jgi:Kef-type K+ transport system membrane component KefB
METNIGILNESASVLGLIVTIVCVSIFTKFASGWIGGKIIGFKNKDSAIIGLATIPQLSTTLAVVFTAVETGLLPEELIAAMVVLSIVTTLIAPIGLRILAR